MKKLLPIIISIAIIGATASYFYLQANTPAPTSDAQEEIAVYTNPELGIAFTYRSGANGYTLSEDRPQSTDPDLVRSITLMRTTDVANLKNIPVGSEWPAAMNILVFANTKKQWPQTWADAHPQFSNIPQKVTKPIEAVIGGANAIRYQADGLYMADTAVVAHGDSVYVFTGQFLEKDSDLYRDFQPLIESVRFIPKPGQE